MTMPSVDCTPPYVQHMPQRALIFDRIKQRINNYNGHQQKCLERYRNAQRQLRLNEKHDTSALLQRVQEMRNKKGAKFKPDAARQKASDNGDGNDVNYPMTLSRLKRKLQLDGCDGQGVNSNGYGENSSRPDPKKGKHDHQNMATGQRQDYSMPSVSVQIVQNFGNKPAERIETTVNVQSNRNMPESQSVSVNVGSTNIKQETNEGRPQQPQQQMGAMNHGPPSNQDSSDMGGLSEDDIIDGDLENILYELMQQEDMLDVIGRGIMTPDGQMTSQSQQMTSQTQQMTSQSQQITMQPQQMTSPGQHMSSPPHHMPSPGQHMTSPAGHMTSQSMPSQMQRQTMCKTEKVDMFPGFHGNMPENKHDNPGIARNQHSMTQQNISANIMTQQSMHVGGNNFTANMSTQQNISLNMSATQQNVFPPNMRHGNVPHPTGNMTANNNNMTSQHIHRLNQVSVQSQFAPPHSSPEPPRLFHPPAGSQGPQGQSGYYESHSQQLKQLAEKRWGMASSASVNMTSDIRAAQNFPQYHSGEGPTMNQQMSMPSHPMAGPGNQRLSHLDTNMYSRPSPPFIPNQRSGTVNMSMSQSMTQIQHEAAMMKQRANAQYQMQNQNNYYNRIPDPHHHQQVMPPNASVPFPPSGIPQPWNTRAPPSWPASSAPNMMQRPSLPSDPMQRPHVGNEMPQGNYLPELDMQSNVDLNILDEILANK